MPNQRFKKEVSFKISRRDNELLWAVLARFEREEGGLSPNQRQQLAMDLLACHANGCPLDFEKLFNVEPVSFGHDIYGIQRYLDRKTGELRNHFLPRCARPSHA